VSGSPFATLPNPPADSRWTEAEDYRVRVAWTNTNPATTRYEIQTSNDFPNWYTSSHVSDPGATDLMVGSLQESLSSNTTWWFRIRALGHSGTHSNFDTSFFKVTKPRPPLSAVYSNVAPSSLTLNWAHNNNSALFTRYSVTMSSTGIVDGEGRFMDVIETKNVLGNTTGFLSLGTNTTYFFQITTIDNGNWNLEHRDLTLQTSTSTLAAVPTAAAAPFSDVQLTSVRVHWDPSGNPDRTRYEVEASSDLTQTFGFISSSATVGGVPSVLASSAVLSGLAYNTTYFFRVSAVNNNGVETEPYVIDSTATLANTPNISGFTPQTTSLTVQIDPIDNPLGTVYVVENTTAGHSSGNITETSWLDGGLSINTSYYFRAQAINHDGVPTEFSASTYAWTLAAVPPAPTVGLLSRNSLRIQFSEGTNPSHTQFAIRAELVENDGNGFAGDPKHQGMFLTKTTGNTTNVYTLDVSSTDVTNPDIWHTLEEWDPYGVVIATGLGAARNYYFAIYARNGAQVVTDASLTDAGRTGADNPVIYLGSHYLNDGHAEHWVSTNTLGFTAARAYHYHYQFTQAIADPASSDPGWNGKLGGTELSDQRTDVNSLQPLAGFHASAEGLWYLQLLGDEYGVGEGFDTDHVTSPLYYSVPFPVKVDLIKPEIPSLTAQFASDDDTPIVDGEATPDSTPYFMWSEPTNGTAGAISPILGYTYSLSTDPSVEPAMSAADATFSTGTTKSVNSPTAPGKYYFKVRALDAAGNWTNPPRSFVYVNKEDKDAPTVSAITSGYGSLSLPGYMMEISVNPKATPTIVFSEPMYRRSVERPGNISLAAVRNNYGQTVNNVIAGSVTYNTLTMTATFWPGEELPRGYRFELLVSTIVTDLARNPLVRPESKIFHTFMDPEMSNVIHSEDGKTRITFSSGSWSGFYGDVAVNENPMGAPMAAPAISSLINQANSHAKRQHGAFAQSVIIRELNLYDETATRRSGKFANDVELVMSYPDADNDGFVD
ncbi:MAG: fibronectin type III domain-containing protein, partial [Elusimicrobia bacterium]|nr:fibronectin type III domain-containing protein [Elusimicrobiota bacterium]